MKAPEIKNYGKGKTEQPNTLLVCTDKADFYYSYNTVVAVFVHEADRFFVRENVWGPTTGKHLNWIDSGKTGDRMSFRAFSDALLDHNISVEA